MESFCLCVCVYIELHQVLHVILFISGEKISDATFGFYIITIYFAN